MFVIGPPVVLPAKTGIVEPLFWRTGSNKKSELGGPTIQKVVSTSVDTH
jgi:hypothetical protein